MQDAHGRQLRTLTLKSTEEIKDRLEFAATFHASEDMRITIRDVVVPLLLDTRNVLIATLDVLQGMNANLVALVQISAQMLQKQEVDVRSKILGGR